MTQRFLAVGRLTRPTDFQRVYAARCSTVAGGLVIYVARNDRVINRFGFSVSKRRVGTAVHRNRVKRMLREACRLIQSQLPGGFDVVFVTRSAELPCLDKLIATLPNLMIEVMTRARPGSTDVRSE